MREIQKDILDTTNMRDSPHKEYRDKQQKDVVISFLEFCFKWYKNSERFFHLLVGLPSYEKYLDYHRKSPSKLYAKNTQGIFHGFSK